MPTIASVKSRMDTALDAVRREFASVRTGKATPSLLDTVRVDAYGSKLPLNQVSTVSAPEPSLIVIQPFDPSLLGAIERGIFEAGLNLTPANDGRIIRVPLPPLNEERRKEYVKILHKMAEEGRVSIRLARRDGNDEIKKRMKDGELSDDQGRKEMDEVQKLTDQHIGKIDEFLAAKEREVLTV